MECTAQGNANGGADDERIATKTGKVQTDQGRREQHRDKPAHGGDLAVGLVLHRPVELPA